MQFIFGDIENLLFKFQYQQANIQTGTTNGLPLKKSYTIGVVYPKGGSNAQEALYNCQAANKLGWNVYCFGFEGLDIQENKAHGYYVYLLNQIINFFLKPGFVIDNFPHFLFKGDDTAKYAIVDIMTQDVIKYRENKIKDFSSFAWMSMFQGFIIYGDEDNWLKSLITELTPYYKVNDNYIFNTYPSVYSTDFQPSPKNNLFFCGNHWDKRRGSPHYGEIYKLLDNMDYFEVYGSQESWTFLHKAYKGLIPSGSQELIMQMQHLGIALLLHTDMHLQYGIPSLRIFEAAAASNAVISDRHPFIEREFGNCVYYINPDKDAQQVVHDIDSIVKFLQNHKHLANEKARCIHNIFNKRFTLESQLLRIAQMHEKIQLNAN